jgi:predicted hydrolase (HD superfamily)
MLEYIFFHDEPRKQFLHYLESLDIPHVEQDDIMGMIVAVPEDLGEEIEDQIEAHYDKLMEDAEERLAEAGEAAEKDVAAITISLQNGDTIYASVDPKVLNRILSVITTQELNDLVNSIVNSVENPDDRPFCNR